MQVVTSPQALPGCCAMPGCGSATRGSYIDTGRQEEFYGAVYICNLCVKEMARMMGFLIADDAMSLREALEEARSSAFEWQKRAIAQEAAIRELVSAGYLLPRPSGDDSLALHPAQGSVEEPSGAGDNLGEGERTTPEPGDDEGMGELRPDAGDDEPSFVLHF